MYPGYDECCKRWDAIRAKISFEPLRKKLEAEAAQKAKMAAEAQAREERLAAEKRELIGLVRSGLVTTKPILLPSDPGTDLCSQTYDLLGGVRLYHREPKRGR